MTLALASCGRSKPAADDAVVRPADTDGASGEKIDVANDPPVNATEGPPDMAAALDSSADATIPFDGASEVPEVSDGGYAETIVPWQCQSLATYCAGIPSSVECSGPHRGCACMSTWSAALAAGCDQLDRNAELLFADCGGYNVFIEGSVEDGSVWYYDAVTLQLVGVAISGPYTISLTSNQSVGCRGGNVPFVITADCKGTVPACPP